MDMSLIVIFLLAGFIIGWLLPDKHKILNYTSFITNTGLIILLLTMGAKIGSDDRVLKQLDYIGFQALILAAAAITGSVIMVKLATLFMGSIFNFKQVEVAASSENNKGNHMTFIIVLATVTGIVAGVFFIPDTLFTTLDKLVSYALSLLLLGIGVDLGASKGTFLKIKELGPLVLIIPIMVVIGSIGGAVICGVVLGLTGHEAAAVGAGFGWYSLSGVILTNIYSVQLGSLAFLANVLRELLSILILPFVVRYLGKVTAIAPGGATTMDVTLPIIKETAGEEMVIPAFINGVILSMLVPILVPLLI